MNKRWHIIGLAVIVAFLGATIFVWRHYILKHRAEQIVLHTRVEKTITIIPGWNLHDIAKYLEAQGLCKADSFLAFTGEQAQIGGPLYDGLTPFPTSTNELMSDWPGKISLEGYLAPDTYRVYADATAQDILNILLDERASQFTPELRADITKQKRTIHEVLTMASILEREVKTPADKAKVADIFWRRHDVGMVLQADSTVHYATGKTGTVFTTNEDRHVDNLWNTYKYPKLPPGPISNPSLGSIRSAVYPIKNDAWYFLTTLDTGEVKYARTLAEQNANAAKFLKNKN